MWKLCGEELAAKARDSGYTNDLSPPCRHGVRFSRCQCTSPQFCTVCVVTCGEPSSSPNCVCTGRRSGFHVALRPRRRDDLLGTGTVWPYHAIFKCPALAGYFKSITDNLRPLNLPPDLSSLCGFRDNTGWGLAVDTAKLIFTSGVAAHS